MGLPFLGMMAIGHAQDGYALVAWLGLLQVTLLVPFDSKSSTCKGKAGCDALGKAHDVGLSL